MPWHEKTHQTPFDQIPIPGQFHLIGDLLAKRYQQERLQNQKYRTVTYPSGLVRELWDSSDEGGIVNVFGALELPRASDRDAGFRDAIEFAREYNYTVGRRGDNDLLVFHPYSGHGYVITYDNQAQQITNIKRSPAHAMDLLDIESRAILPELYSNEKLGLDAVAPVKFFTPDANWTWYPTEYDGDDIFFGLVAGFEVELGYFSLTELEGIKGALGLPVERDLYYQPTALRQLQSMHRGL